MPPNHSNIVGLFEKREREAEGEGEGERKEGEEEEGERETATMHKKLRMRNTMMSKWLTR